MMLRQPDEAVDRQKSGQCPCRGCGRGHCPPRVLSSVLAGLTMVSVLTMLLYPRCDAYALDIEAIEAVEMQQVGRHLHEQLTLRNADAQTRRRHAERLDHRVDHLLESQHGPDAGLLVGAFVDVKPRDEQDIDFARGYFDPVRDLALAHAMPESRHHNSKTVREAIQRALAYNRRHVFVDGPRPGNWWVWNKQMPDCLADLLVLGDGVAAEPDRRYLVNLLDDLVGRGPIADSGYHHGKMARDAMRSLIVGVVTRDRERIGWGWQCMQDQVRPRLLEPDGTPLMTVIRDDFMAVSLPYVYEGYDTVVEWAVLTRGTSMQLSDETIAPVARYLLDMGRWHTVDGIESAWHSFSQDRVFWQPARTLQLAGQLAETDIKQAPRLKAFAEDELPEPVGARYWPRAETLVVRRPGVYIELIMASEPCHKISWSYKNRFLNHGNKWYYGRDGHLVVARNAAERHPNLTFTTNWRRLTGITRDADSLLDSDQIQRQDGDYWQPEWALCRSPMAGAVTLGDHDALAAIEVHTGAMRARKSYAFFSEPFMIAMQGTGITGRGGTETMIHHAPVGSATPTILHAGGEKVLHVGEPVKLATPCWVHANGAGYWFPETGEVTLHVEMNEPDLEDAANLEKELSEPIPPQPFLTVLIDHGSDPRDATYGAVLLPEIDAEAMPALAERLASRLHLHRSNGAHLYGDGDTQTTAAAFFEASQIKGFAADGPCQIMLRQHNGQMTLAAYEPSWRTGRRTLTLPKSVDASDGGGGPKDGGLPLKVKPGEPQQVRWRVEPRERMWE